MSAGINISNYESFLLRFIDGELTAAEEASFLDFLEQHPQVQQELQVWESTVLTPDLQVTFDDKELLYRGQQELDSTNQTGFLLSYLDNELTATERNTVEKYLAAQPAAQAELALLQMTRLEPDMQQVFMPKASLYRHRRRVAPAIWWSAGVAAMVAGLLVWVLPMQDKHDANNGALVASVQHTTTTTPVPQAQVAVPQQHATSVTPVQPGVTNTNTTQTIAQASSHTGTTVATNPQKTQLGIHTTISTAANTGAALVATTPANVVNNTATNANSKLIAAATSNGNTDNTTLSRTTTANNTTSNTETVTVSTPPAIAVSNQETPVEKAPVMLAAASTKEQASPSIHGELIASVVSTGDSKLLDKVTNVARFFAKKKANNK